jgi:hypothetical protein
MKNMKNMEYGKRLRGLSLLAAGEHPFIPFMSFMVNNPAAPSFR